MIPPMPWHWRRHHPPPTQAARHLALVVALGLAGCAPTPDRPSVGLPSSNVPTEDTARTPVFAESDRRLVMETAASLVYPHDAARLAEQRTHHPQLLAYAARVAKDHAASLDGLRRLAAARGLAVPELPLPDQRVAVEALQALQGDAFDQQFLQQIGVRQHEATLRLCETVAATATDAELRGWASRQLVALREHLAAARQLQLPVHARSTDHPVLSRPA